LAYLAAVSEKAGRQKHAAQGHQVRVYDGDVEELPLEAALREFEPQIVGVTANTTQITAAWRDAALVKQVSSAPVVLGGPHPTVLPDESAAKPFVDAVVRSEGEATWSEILARVDTPPHPNPLPPGERGQDGMWEGILGVTFRRADGTVVSMPDRPPIPVEELDAMPFPAWHLFRLERYTNLQPAVDQVSGHSLPILTSRGCPYRCTYCSQIGPRRWRARSAASVLSEWRWLVREQGAVEIGVLDDSFNINRQRVLEICQALVDEGLHHVPWIMINGIRANLADEEVLGAMKRAGCIRTAFGVESGNQTILDTVVDKHLTLDQVRSAFRAARAVGLETIGFFIIGLPGETRQTMQDTINFAIELDPLIANFSMMTPYPGTKVYEIVKRQGKMLVSDWEDYVFFEQKARYEMGDMSAELVEEMYRKAYRQFYLRPGPIMRRLQTRDFWFNLPRNARIARRTFFKKEEKTELRRVIEAEGLSI
jgi:radical SAM superfamily enzyme YgiQ (UPF0313 family)